MTPKLSFALRSVASLLLLGSATAPTALGQSNRTLPETDVRAVLQTALRSALQDFEARHPRAAGDSSVALDTVFLGTLGPRNGVHVYRRVPSSTLNVGKRILPTSRETSFDCPPEIQSPAITEKCTARGTGAYVRVFNLVADSDTSALLTISVIVPNRARDQQKRFLSHTVRVQITKTATGWNAARPIAWVAG